VRGRRRALDDGESFFDADPSRDPLVKSVVEILERSDHLEKLRRTLEDREYADKRRRFENRTREFNKLRAD
jgi:hypothetical protein